MDARESLRIEAQLEPSVRALVRQVNRRLSSAPAEGDTWVRIRPPSVQELESDERHPTLVKFYRVGTVVQIAEVLTDFVEVACHRDTMMISIREFLDTWVKTDSWPHYKLSSRPPE
jgi:hypothetical protein